MSSWHCPSFSSLARWGRKSIWMILVPVIRHCLNWPGSHLMQLNWIKPLVRAIVAVAQALNLQVIAEGVESAKEDAFLTKNGVNERQGFLFAKPMPAAAFERWYRRHLNKKTR